MSTEPRDWIYTTSRDMTGDDPSSGQLMHYWTVRITPDGKAMLFDQGGNFPPQAVR
jgi:hypothetical protein